MLAKMMPYISEQAKLSFRYRNHSFRATAITALDDTGIEARHIMRTSGHKSEVSIRSYAKRLSENKKTSNVGVSEQCVGTKCKRYR
jgi:integrase